MNLHQMVENGKFCCENGLCLPSELRCDGTIDCVDHSDEKNCNLVHFEKSNYKKNKPPSPKVIRRFPIKPKNYTTNIGISIEIVKMIDIKEANSEVTIFFSVLLFWKDPRLKFDFLKESKENNVINEGIWIPKFRFGNQKKWHGEYPGDLQVLREGKMTENSRTQLTMKQLYEGSENTITMETNYQINFICSFDNIGLYPFDNEFCNIDIYNSRPGHKFIRFIPKNKEYFGKRLVGQYTVENISLEAKEFMQGVNGVRVNIKLGRDLQTIFCVTYLPTILMNMINQATVYLDITQFLDAIITVNITCMMVLSALFISVSNSLPPTAEIKYIDIWLLYSLFFPFMIILLNILLSLVQEHNLKSANNVKPMKTIESEKNMFKKILYLKLEKMLRIITVYLNPLTYVVFSSVYFLYGAFYLYL